MKKVQFTLNGKSACVGGPGPKAKKLIEFVQSIPDGKYFDVDGIGKITSTQTTVISKITRENVDEFQGHILLVPNVNGSGRKMVYGSKDGIAALKKELQKAGVI